MCLSPQPGLVKMLRHQSFDLKIHTLVRHDNPSQMTRNLPPNICDGGDIGRFEVILRKKIVVILLHFFFGRVR